MSDFDVVVIGAGPGGYVAAVRAAQLGFKTAIVERAELGGVCLNWGCIPTKALLKASEMAHAFEEAESFGFTVAKPKVDVKKLIARSRDVAGNLSNGIGFLMKKNKIEVITGEAAFKDKHTLTVNKKDISFKYAIIATGARARTIPGVLEADGKNIWTAKEAMVPDALPKSLLVIGAGAIGIEFASFYANLGTEVTVVEALDRVLPVEDAEISKTLGRSLKKQGIKLMLNAKVNSLKATKTGVNTEIETKKTEKQSFDKALIAIGVQGNVEGLNIDKAGVKEEKSTIQSDKLYRTATPHIYAIGDVAGPPWLAHVASHEGVVAVEHIGSLEGKCAEPHEFDYENVPGCTYCRPQVASVGLTEEKAAEAGHKVKVGRYNYQANGKAQAIGEAEGLVKTVFDEATGELLGAHIVGAEATEMISTFMLARHLETTEAELISACFPHPTLSEMLHESVLDSEGRTLNA